MKKIFFALSVFCSALIPSQSFAGEVPNCYTQMGVMQGQFIVFLDQNISATQQDQVVSALGDLNLSIVNHLGFDTLLVERAALSEMSAPEQEAVLAGLEALIGNGVSMVTCNGLIGIF